MMIRPAGIPDIPAAHKIINDSAEYGLMLPRSLASMYEDVRDFHVAVQPVGDAGEGGKPGERVVGVCGLKVVWANLAEVYALAVHQDARGQGVGRRLVGATVDEAERLGIRKLMTLTYERVFFERCGFSVVDRQELPLKVWSECVRCPKNQRCDEIAMIRVLESVTEIRVPATEPPAPANDRYIVPVTMSARRVRFPAALPDDND